MSNPLVVDPIQYLRDTGLLFEINRTILHPFGLALAVHVDDEISGTTEFSCSLWDYRNDPEGVLFRKDDFHSGMENLLTFLNKFGIHKLNERKKRIGFTIQKNEDQ